MVLSFFRRGESGLEHIEHQIVAMLGDARHSFDLACSAVLGGADPGAVSDDVVATDERINHAEQSAALRARRTSRSAAPGTSAS
jgi:hypothetical protein